MVGGRLSYLDGVRIAGFTQFLLGPAAAQYLGDLGADVIKVESPAGAWERGWSGKDTFLNGVSVFYLLAHRNVRSVSVDLKRDEGRAVALRIIESCDVVVENFRPGVMDRLGLGYERVRAVNPGVIYASASGFGEDGPGRDLPGQDLLVQAACGLASITGRAGEPPTPAGAAVVDQHGAALLAMGILAALMHRERTGEGQRIELSMMESALDLQMEALVYHLNGAELRRPREPLGSSFHPAPYGVYETADGHLALSFAPLDRLRTALGDPLELEPFDDGMLMDRREDIHRALQPLLRKRPTGEWIGSLRAAGIWCAPVNDYDAVLRDPIVEHLAPTFDLEHPTAGSVRLFRHPVRYGAGERRVATPPPAVGQNSIQVLEELGYAPGEIDALLASEVIHAPPNNSGMH